MFKKKKLKRTKCNSKTEHEYENIKCLLFDQTVFGFIWNMLQSWHINSSYLYICG